ncbi:hypothetical protein KDH02_004809 [Salmonella enterica]|nr:hypothetical protein [Salmonella enterica]EHL2886999.1 hypothetical protein [Salmonella enterica]
MNDTLKISTDINNFKDITKADSERYEYIISNATNLKSCRQTIGMNLNRANGRYNMIESLKESEKKLLEIMDDLTIIEKHNVEMNRIDIAIDSKMKFEECKRFIGYIFMLVTYSDKQSYKVKLSDMYSDNVTGYVSKSRDLEIVFYDKALESEGQHKYNTRMEFRYKRIKTLDFKMHIDKLIRLIRSIDVNIELLDKKKIEALKKLYDKAIRENKATNFSQFVICYSDSIYTKEQLKALYEYANMQGDFTNWLSFFRKSHSDLEFQLFNKTDVKKYKSEVIKSIKKYRNS